MSSPTISANYMHNLSSFKKNTQYFKVISFIVFCLGFLSADAQKLWTGTVDNNWSNPLNWAGFSLPGTNSRVEILGGAPHQPSINSSSVTIRSITIESGATLTVNSGSSLTLNTTDHDALLNEGTVENYGVIDINRPSGSGDVDGIENTGTFNNQLTASISIDEVSDAGISNSGGTFNNHGRIDIGADVPVGSNWDIFNEGTFNNADCRSLIICHAKNIYNDGSFINDGNIIENGTGTSSITTNNGVVQNLNGGTFNIGTNNGTYNEENIKIWTGCFNDNWEALWNWHGHEKPTASDDVMVYSQINDPSIPASPDAFAKSINISSGATLTISVSGKLIIDGADEEGLLNDGTVLNNGDLEIGQGTGTGDRGILNNGTFTNSATATITLDNTGFEGIRVQGSGVFTNMGNMDIGQNGGSNNIQGDGIHLLGTFNNNGGTIQIDNIFSDGFDVGYSGEFYNSATLHIGKNGGASNIADIGLENGNIFTNNVGGVVTIDNVASRGILSNETITNYGAIEIGKVGDFRNIENGGLKNFGTFENKPGAVLSINNSGVYGFENIDNRAILNNEGTIAIEFAETEGIHNRPNASIYNLGTGIITIKKADENGILNNADFVCSMGSSLSLNDIDGNAIYNNSGLFDNDGDITIGEDVTNQLIIRKWHFE